MLDIILGVGLLYGDVASRHFLTCITKYVLYVWFNITIYAMNYIHTSVDSDVYNEILKMYYTIPYNVDKYFYTSPYTYECMGWVLILYGIRNAYKSSCKQ